MNPYATAQTRLLRSPRIKKSQLSEKTLEFNKLISEKINLIDDKSPKKLK